MSKPLPSPNEIARIPPSGGGGFNRLIHEKSPYLLQHAPNPVDWYPWGEEAFAKAKAGDKPVFVSIGYSTCHWCHVMERESFESEDIAAVMNERFVPIKVDREERPDLDDVFMHTTQLLTGRGGWPNSVWLTPDGRPWYAGTYFPPEDRGGQPGFGTLLTTLADIWRTRRKDVEAQADELTGATRQAAEANTGGAGGRVDAGLIDGAISELTGAFDRKYGGFDGAPKFPPHAALRFILYENAFRPSGALLEMATRTLDGMAGGGIHDRIGGGFHRYSVDARWFLPHFEKMLYDNALLVRSYTDAYLATGNDLYRWIAANTIEWVLREMTGKEGGFSSAADADTAAGEGAYYLWTRDEVVDALGEEEADFFCRLHGVRQEGNIRDEATGEPRGGNILHCSEPLSEVATRDRVSLASLRDRLMKDYAALHEARSRRPRPFIDDKAITAWNGLMIGALAYAGRHLLEARYVEAGRAAAAFILANVSEDGRLARYRRDGESRLQGCLDDYAFLAEGLLELYDATEDNSWFEQARALTDTTIAHFYDRERGGFFYASDDHERLIVRARDVMDKGTASSNGIMACVLVRLARSTGSQEYLNLAQATADTFSALVTASPQATMTLVLAADMLLGETVEAGEHRTTRA